MVSIMTEGVREEFCRASAVNFALSTPVLRHPIFDYIILSHLGFIYIELYSHLIHPFYFAYDDVLVFKAYFS